MKPSRREREGMALLTVLLLVAVMAALSVVMLDDIRFSVRRATNASSMDQAQWYGLGAETLARSQVRRLMDQNSSRTPLEPEWNGRTFDFPVDEGGAIRVTVRDGQACFNLNSVVSGQGEALARNDGGVRQLLALARATGVAEARARVVADGLVDWIDTDSRSEPLGGEDGAYAGQATPYRTGGTLLSEVSELRAVRGVSAEDYARLRPHLCALPATGVTAVNVNTLTPDQAVLLVMMTDGRLSESAARRVIAARPPGGWTDTAAFWGQPTLAGITPSNAAYDQAGVFTRFFALDARVAHGGAEAVMSALIEAAPGGAVRTVARRWTTDE